MRKFKKILCGALVAATSLTSVSAIAESAAYDSDNPYKSSNFSLGCRITPTLLKFFLNNPYLV